MRLTRCMPTALTGPRAENPTAKSLVLTILFQNINIFVHPVTDYTS